jgi:integrase
MKRMPKTYQWVPKKLPRNWPYTAHRDGWTRWYKGAARFICGKATPLDDVDERWVDKKKEIDAGLRDARRLVGTSLTIREAAGLYYDFLDYRFRTGQPEPISEATVADYKRSINAFGRGVGPDRTINSLEQRDFSDYAKRFADNAPSTLARVVAAVQAFLRWCRDEGHVAELPQWGRYFVKPSMQDNRDQRLSSEKSYAPELIRKLYCRARIEEKLWILLGLCGAHDNSDIAHLTHDVLDRSNGTIDYRRRKRGKVRRVIPMPDVFWRLLDEYQRPAAASPEFADRVFLTPTGLPLQRIKRSEGGNPVSIDYVALRWTRLMIAAGERPKMPGRRKVGRKTKTDEQPRERRFKAKGSSGGKGFRGLRTTFPNMAPPRFRDEVELVMGHKTGVVLIEHYLERYGIDRLKELVSHVFHEPFPLVLETLVTSAPHQGEHSTAARLADAA